MLSSNHYYNNFECKGIQIGGHQSNKQSGKVFFILFKTSLSFDIDRNLSLG